MKFTVSSKVLYDSLSKISGLIGTNNIVPILDNCLINIENGKLIATSSDVENTMRIEIDVDSNENGSLCFPAKKLLEILKSVPEQPLLIELDTDQKIIITKTSNAEYQLSGYDAAEFPKVPELTDTNTITIVSDALLKAINTTNFALGTDELRKVMTGLYCHFDEHGATFVSTDAQKLVKYQRKDVKSSENVHFILPKKVLAQLKSTLSSYPQKEVSIRFNKSNASFQFENLVIVCRLIDGVYPEYNNVIPIENPNKMTIPRDTFLNAVRRLSPISNPSTNQVNLKIEGSKLTISSLDLDFSNKGHEEYAVSYVGTDMSIGFSSKFLIEVLQSISTDDITLGLSTPNRAGLIFPVDEHEAESTMMLLMPILVNVE